MPVLVQVSVKHQQPQKAHTSVPMSTTNTHATPSHLPQATREVGSSRMQASRTASETWSQILSNHPSNRWFVSDSSVANSQHNRNGRLTRVSLVDRLGGEEESLRSHFYWSECCGIDRISEIGCDIRRRRRWTAMQTLAKQQGRQRKSFFRVRQVSWPGHGQPATGRFPSHFREKAFPRLGKLGNGERSGVCLSMLRV